MSMWVTGISAAVSVGTSIYSASQANKAANKALDQKAALAANLKYEPIDIAALKEEASKSAVENATKSLALERTLQPNVAATREELAKQTSDNLALQGNLPADVINRVTQSGRVIGAQSGIGSGSTTPLTASLLGLSSLDLANQRRAAAGALLTANPLQQAGLDPGAVASAEVAQNAAQNQFNLLKSGVDSKLVDAETAARAAQIGGQTGIASSFSNLAFGAQTPQAGGLLGSYLKSKPVDTTAGYAP